MSLYQSSVHRPIMTALVYVAVAIIGVFCLTKLPIDLFPDMGGNHILVFTVYPGSSSADIENNVTKPLENALNSVSDLKELTSQSKENYSIVTLEFEYGIDIEVAMNDVRDKLDQISSALPDDCNDPFLFRFSMDDIPILMLSVQSGESTNALYKILDDKVASLISRVGGVGTVSISGAPQREIAVYCDPYKLEEYNLTVESIASIISAENRNLPLGSIDIGSETYSMRLQHEFTDASQLNDIVVASVNNQNVFLKDVAVVRDTVQERMQEVYNNGVRGAMIIVQKQSGANSVQVSKKVMEMLPEIQKTLPSDVKIGVIANTSDSIVNTINSLKDSIIVILVLVVLVVLLFLGRWRATFIIAIVIPVSLVAAFIYLALTGNSLNIISLSSLSIAIGMVVDDAIVVLENITTHIERGTKPKAAAVFATSEVSLSVIATTLVLLAVFVPLTFLTGQSGILFKQLGWTVAIVCSVSTIAALSLTPMLCSLMLKSNPSRGKVFGAIYKPIEKFLDWLDRSYKAMLTWCVTHRAIVVMLALLIFGGSLMLLKIIPTEFFPTQDMGRMSATVKLPVGTRMEESRAFGLKFTNQMLKNYPEIQMCNFSVGQPDEDNSFGIMSETGSHIVKFNMRFANKVDRTRSISEIADNVRADLAQYPELYKYQVSTGNGGMGGQSSVDIELYCYDFAIADEFAAALSDRMSKVKGCSEVNISRTEYIPELHVEFDREKLAEHGLNSTTAGSYIRNRFSGSIASYYREDGDEYNIKVRYNQANRQAISDIENIMIYTPTGAGLRVKDLGTVKEKLTPPTIERKNRERVVTVSCVVGKDGVLSEVVDGANDVLNHMDIPAEVSYKIGGTWEDQQESFGDLTTLMVLIVLLVYIVMSSQFESFTYPFVIMFSIPFAFTGVFIGLAVTQTPLGIMALIGILMLIGIVVKNGIVLIDYTILCRERGLNIKEAVVTAGKSRLRPILMTTLTTVLGMIPLAVGNGEGAEMWNSLGMTVAWGLSVSTLVTLVLIPILYSLFADFGQWRKNRKAAKVAVSPSGSTVVLSEPEQISQNPETPESENAN
ncbi:MAG: efflux RND transporter permease subunit [Bacteroidales bacterium]|nr:efflux RND transporter permease subunit [Bacteroidales bacterium]